MRNFDESTITGAVLERIENARTARVRQVSDALVRHLHALIREIEPTFEEWGEAIAFLTAVGKKCSDTRQEFILLSDTLGASMLVDAINHRLPKGATETTVLGPFFVEGEPQMALGSDISPGAPGEPLFVEGSVSSVGGGPLPGATIDVWHSDKDGYYDVQHYDEGGATTMRARFSADAEWTLLVLDDRSQLLSHSRRRAGRRYAAGAGPASFPPRPRPFHDFRAGIRDAGHACVHRRRQIS